MNSMTHNNTVALPEADHKSPLGDRTIYRDVFNEEFLRMVYEDQKNDPRRFDLD